MHRLRGGLPEPLGKEVKVLPVLLAGLEALQPHVDRLSATNKELRHVAQIGSDTESADGDEKDSLLACCDALLNVLSVHAQ